MIFARIVRPMNALQLCRWQVFTQRNFVADFLQAKCDFRRKTAVLRFWSPFGCLGATYDNHHRLIGKRVVDFLLVLIEFFFARCNGWGATSAYRFKIGDFSPTGAGWPKISGRRVAPTNHYSYQKTKLNDLSYGIKIWIDLTSVSHNARVWHTDRRTDVILIIRPRLHCMQRGNKTTRGQYRRHGNLFFWTTQNKQILKQNEETARKKSCRLKTVRQSYCNSTIQTKALQEWV